MALKVLLADDSMTAQRLGKKILTEAGYEVIAVSNGAAAIKKIASEKPDLAVLDVYMPGYSGLEVCDKIKKAPETARMPVLLTVGKLEPFKAEEGNKVKADGVIIKPFEASDLLAVVQKLAEKLAAAEYEDTVKIPVPYVEEAKGPAYEEWKVTAEEPPEEAVAGKVEVPADMAGAPVSGMELVGEEEAQPAPAAESVPAERDTIAPERPAEAAAAESTFGRVLEAIASAQEAPAASAPDTAEMEAFHSTAEPVAAAPAAAPEVEFTAAPAAAEAAAVTEPGLEPTVMSAEEGGTISAEPALVTDASQMATEFVTRFGVAQPEEIPVGVAAEVPGLYADTQPAAQPPGGWMAEETLVEEGEKLTSLEQEMQRAFASAAAEPETHPVEEAVVAPITVAPEGAPNQELAAAMAAAIGGPEAVIAAPGVDANLIAAAVDRALERLKPQLIAEITQELSRQ